MISTLHLVITVPTLNVPLKLSTKDKNFFFFFWLNIGCSYEYLLLPKSTTAIDNFEKIFDYVCSHISLNTSNVLL